MNRQFPPEIIQLIVEASLDRSDMLRSQSRDIQPRYATLRSYSLLNSTWCGASQAELVKWVQIRTEESAIRFLELVQQRGGTLDGVQDMFVSSSSFTDASTPAKLLRCAPQVINLRLYRGTVDIEDLAQLQQLRRLDLDRSSIVGSPSSSLLRLPQLQRLSLYKSPTHFLTPTFLPRLRRVDTIVLSSIAPLIQQLEIINARPLRQDYPLLARAKSLLLLPVPYDRDELSEMLTKLPSLPPFLHTDICYHPTDHHDLVLALEDLLSTKKAGLRVIFLNDYGIDDAIEALIKRFQERGIRVERTGYNTEFAEAIVRMQEIIGKEKRAAEQNAEVGR